MSIKPKTFLQFDLIVFRFQRKLNTLLRFKYTLNKKIRSFLGYICTCGNCNVTYYGKTPYHFITKAAEHVGVSNLTRKRLKNIKGSAVADHLLQCNCTIDCDHFDILVTDVCKFNLLGKESFFIKRDKQNN